jgi:hypothetical protein
MGRMIYRLPVGTGFRAGEFQSLTLGRYPRAVLAAGAHEAGRRRRRKERPCALTMAVLRKLGKREVRGILATKAEEPPPEAKRRASGRKKRQ